MPATAYCFLCSHGKEEKKTCPYYMFMRRGQFCRKAFLNEEIWLNDCGGLKEKYPHVLDLLKKMGGRQFRVCTFCRDKLLENDITFDIFLGYLTKTEYKRYSDYAQQSTAINNDGYAVVRCGEFKYPRRTVFKHIKSNKSSTLASGSINRNNRRKWSNFQTHVGKTIKKKERKFQV